MIEAIIFDCDGTLVNSEILCNRALVIILRQYGIQEDEDAMTGRFRGRKLSSIIYALEQHYRITFNEGFVEEYRATVDKLFGEHLEPIEGVAEMLEQLTVPFCVASNGPREKIQRALSITGLSKFFDQRIFSSYEVGSWKPAPELFLQAAGSMNVPPEHCLVVEDSTVGVLAANRADMQACLFDASGRLKVDPGYRFTRITAMRDLVPTYFT